jgi:hypothetical protein
MRYRVGEQAVIALAIAYLIALSQAMTYLSYDIWGAFIMLPPLALIGAFGVRRMFSGTLRPLAQIMYLALVLKFVGAAAKYFVSFGAYGGSTDAQAYHEFGLAAANRVWSGKQGIGDVLPSGTGTVFMQHLTSFVYTLTGTSKMGGYLLFAWMAFWGVCLFVKGACLAIPGLHKRRYAIWCALGPSIVYWPSSIGKEAVMMLALGGATYGFARLLSRVGVIVPVVVAVASLGLAAAVRPHMAALWIGGLFPALIVALFRGRGQKGAQRGAALFDRLLLLVIIGIAGAALVAVGSATLKFLDPSKEDSTKSTSTDITAILTETSRRTAQAGSAFTPPSVSSPLDWPYASVRTLLRPLLFEAHGAGQLLSALEIAVFMGVCVLSWRRVAHLPGLIFTNPFIAFAMTSLFFSGLAYTSFANLGLLARQKSLLLPLMFLIPCLPERLPKKRRAVLLEREQDLAPFGDKDRVGTDEVRGAASIARFEIGSARHPVHAT